VRLTSPYQTGTIGLADRMQREPTMKNLRSLLQALDRELPTDRLRALEDLTDVALEIVWKIKERVGDPSPRVQSAAAKALEQLSEAASIWIVDGREGDGQGSP